MPTVTITATDREGHSSVAMVDYAVGLRGWDLIWSDEFEGAAVDPSKWNVRNATTLSYDQAYITSRPANIAVHDSAVHIIAQREMSGGRPFTTGYLDTIGKFSQRYGRFEMRAKLPTAPGTSRGLWPAFWLRPDNSANGDGEIDIMESYGTPTIRTDFDPTNRYQWTVWQSEQAGAAKKSGYPWGQPPPGQPTLDAGFHVYAVEWTLTGMTFSLDGVTVGKFTPADTAWFDSSFSGPFHIRLNLQVGSTYWGNPDPAHPELTVLPAEYVIDYIRVYRAV